MVVSIRCFASLNHRAIFSDSIQKTHYNNIIMKRLFILLTLFLFSTFIYSQVLNDSQIINGNHWLYDDFNTLSLETRTANFTSNRPLTVGELRMHFREYDREELSDAGKVIYDRIDEYLSTEKNLFPGKMFQAGLGFVVAPELCYKSNNQIGWTYNYYYKNNFLTLETGLGIADYFSLGGDLFLGKNYYYSTKNDNFTNKKMYNDKV